MVTFLNSLFHRRSLLNIAVLALCTVEFIQFRHITKLHAICSAVDQVTNSLTEIESGQRGFLLTGDSRYLSGYRFHSKLLQFRLDRLCVLLPSKKEDKAVCQDLNAFMTLKTSEMYLTLATYKTGDVSGALAIVKSGKGLDYKFELIRRLEFIKAQYCPYWLMFPL